MFFRFGSAIVLVVAVSLTGIALEKQNLELRREVSRQHYRLEALLDRHARLRLRTQELGAPVRVIRSLENGELELNAPGEGGSPSPSSSMPLLRWQDPSAASGFDGGEPSSDERRLPPQPDSRQP